jgi:hypothetical protein
MISTDDNTAADVLINLIGRGGRESQNQAWASDAQLNVPLLTTREAFVLGGADYPHLADHYLSLPGAQREAYLHDVVDQVPIDRVPVVNAPRQIDRLGWFGSANDMCRAFAGLSLIARNPVLAPLSQALSAYGGGLRLLDASRWPTIWAWGGGGLVNTARGYLARTNDGRTFVVVVLATDPSRSIDLNIQQPTASLIEGAFSLLEAG